MSLTVITNTRFFKNFTTVMETIGERQCKFPFKIGERIFNSCVSMNGFLVCATKVNSDTIEALEFDFCLTPNGKN